MLLFSRGRKSAEAQGFLLKLVNNNCAEIAAMQEGPRADGRVRLTIVVLVTPVRDGRPVIERTFAAVTKEFSTGGMSLVVNEPRPLGEVVLSFRWESDMTYVRAEVKHCNPMGAGFYQLGLQVTELVHVGDYPELEGLRF